MWSDNDIDSAFQRLNQPEPEPTPFPLDAWLRLENRLDEAVIARAVRQRVWRLFAAEVVIVALVVLGWLLWPSTTTVPGSATKPSNAAGLVPHGTNWEPAALRHPAATAPAAVLAAAAPAKLTAKTNSASAPIVIISTASAPKAVHRAQPAAQVAARRAQQAVAAVAPATQRRRATRPAARETTLYGQLVPSAVAATAVARHRVGQRASRRYWAAQQAADPASQPVAARPIASIATGATRSETSKARAVESGSAANSTATLPQSEIATVAQYESINPTETARAAEQPAKAAAPFENATAAAPAMLAPRPVVLPLPAPAELPAPLATVAVAEPAPKLPAPVRQPRFYIGLVGAPDVSTVKFVDVQRPLLNAGLTLEYRISQRLRISTGLLRGNKEYYARREDYDWTNYPRAATRNFIWVDGTCTVLDIPLNLRYDAMVWPRARLFGSAGVSSFVMQRERYTYDYVDNNIPYVWERNFANENQHLFSVLNLSVGYERSLNNRWSLQAEPYLKLPLAGVGAGKVKLTSAGVFLGVKYGF